MDPQNSKQWKDYHLTKEETIQLLEAETEQASEMWDSVFLEIDMYPSELYITSGTAV